MLCHVFRSGRRLKAEALKVVGKERLEWGDVGTLAATFSLLIMVAVADCVTTATAASMIAGGSLVAALKSRTDMGGDGSVRRLIDLRTILTLVPTTAGSVRTIALRIQKVKLELQSIRVVSKPVE
ncbi:molybdate ABC transporter permease [Babesia caballi]|uniref:Molybdate ABC transporter permease n=1 Tax=Babesia caballi TaxID=5871 RepID=A0AAV4LN49_BABCB|nr:molybdate ABC transporter permease [Babesia caballi]